jgi:hypothetical protein
MNRLMRISCFLAVLIVVMSLLASAHSYGARLRVLVVDETRTFASTMRTGALVGALRSSELFEVDVLLGTVSTSFDDPLANHIPAHDTEPYDAIVILPVGLDDGSFHGIWIVSAGLRSLSPETAYGIEALERTVNGVFAGIGDSIDVSEDLWPCFLWSVYSSKGWIR